MATGEMETAIQFLIDHHAKVSADIGRLHETQAEQSKQIAELTKAVAATQSQLDSVIVEMRDNFDKLILASEVTRDLAQKTAELTIQTSPKLEEES